jgi:hypothetical protein
LTSDDGNRAMACLTAIRKGRAWFDAKLVEHMGEHYPPSPVNRLSIDTRDLPKEKATALVRSDDGYHVAEFFYVATELHLLRRDRLPQLIARHNADMEELLSNPKLAQSMGISVERLQRTIFSKAQRTKILHDQEHDEQERLHLDQSDLGRFLSPLMADEQCRKILVAMAKGKLLTMWGKGRVFVASASILEDYFREHLIIIDRAIRGAP